MFAVNVLTTPAYVDEPVLNETVEPLVILPFISTLIVGVSVVVTNFLTLPVLEPIVKVSFTEIAEALEVIRMTASPRIFSPILNLVDENCVAFRYSSSSFVYTARPVAEVLNPALQIVN